jgi:hypothetical protein
VSARYEHARRLSSGARQSSSGNVRRKHDARKKPRVASRCRWKKRNIRPSKRPSGDKRWNSSVSRMKPGARQKHCDSRRKTDSAKQPN